MPMTTIKNTCFETLDQVLLQVQASLKPLRLVVGYSGGLDSAVLVKSIIAISRLKKGV